MCRFFTFLTCIVLTGGAVSDNGIVKVKRGGNFSLFVRTSEPRMVSLKVQKNGTQELFRYCSKEEQNHGCKAKNLERCSLHIGKENFSMTFLDANNDDEGVYVIEVIDDKSKWSQYNYSVSLTEELPSSINPEPPSVHPITTPAMSTKAEETFGTDDPTTTVSSEQKRNIIWGVLGVLLGLVVVAIVVICICCKKQVNRPQKNPQRWWMRRTFLWTVKTDLNLELERMMTKMEVRNILWTQKTTRAESAIETSHASHHHTEAAALL